MRMPIDNYANYTTTVVWRDCANISDLLTYLQAFIMSCDCCNLLFIHNTSGEYLATRQFPIQFITKYNISILLFT